MSRLEVMAERLLEAQAEWEIIFRRAATTISDAEAVLAVDTAMSLAKGPRGADAALRAERAKRRAKGRAQRAARKRQR